jgi:hypothetical protein
MSEDSGLVLEAARFLAKAGRKTEAGELYALLRERLREDPVRREALDKEAGP